MTKRDVDFENKIAWLRQIMDWRQELTDAREFVDSLKTDVFQDRVYTFTPKGDVIDLPAASTPIDFAYYVHTEVGHHCRGARVNGKLVALDHRLQNGDQVEIIAAKRGGPSRDWLNPNLGYVITSRARGKIREWFRKQDREVNIVQGRETLEREMKRLSIDKVSYEELARLFGFERTDDFLAAIGYGDLNTQQIASKVLETQRKDGEGMPEIEKAPPPLTVEGLKVRGVGSLLTTVARCCNPLPGDDIIGYVTRGRGVTIHRQDCPNILRKKDKERLIEVNWDATSQQTYPVTIRVEAFDRTGLLRDIANLVADEKINLRDAAAVTGVNENMAIITATLEIAGIAQLSRILNKIERLPNVVEARRRVG
jgi:GTP pyrophosphokinase